MRAHECIRSQNPIAQIWSSLLELPRGSSVCIKGAKFKMETAKPLYIVELWFFFVRAHECIRTQNPIAQIWSSLLELPRGSSVCIKGAKFQMETAKPLYIGVFKGSNVEHPTWRLLHYDNTSSFPSDRWKIFGKKIPSTSTPTVQVVKYSSYNPFISFLNVFLK